MLFIRDRTVWRELANDVSGQRDRCFPFCLYEMTRSTATRFSLPRLHWTRGEITGTGLDFISTIIVTRNRCSFTLRAVNNIFLFAFDNNLFQSSSVSKFLGSILIRIWTRLNPLPTNYHLNCLAYDLLCRHFLINLFTFSQLRKFLFTYYILYPVSKIVEWIDKNLEISKVSIRIMLLLLSLEHEWT